MQSIKYSAILLAGGLSKRFNKDKLIYKINNEMIINHSIEPFKNDSLCERIFVVVHITKYDFYKKLFRFIPKITLVVAEKTRMLSFKKAFEFVKTQHIIIHDAARPYLKEELLNDIKNELMFQADAVVPLVNLSEPLVWIKNNEQKQIYQNEYYFAQTPQGYTTISINEIINNSSTVDLFDNINDVYEIYKINQHNLKFINGDIENKLIVTDIDVK